MPKFLRYKNLKGEIEEIELYPEDEQILNRFFEESKAEEHMLFRGITIKKRNAEIIEKKSKADNIDIEFSWTDQELLEWEAMIFPKFNTFKDYLIARGAWVVTPKYPDGAVRDPKLYFKLTKMWSALQDLRYRQRMAAPEGREEYRRNWAKLREWIKQQAWAKSVNVNRVRRQGRGY